MKKMQTANETMFVYSVAEWINIFGCVILDKTLSFRQHMLFIGILYPLINRQSRSLINSTNFYYSKASSFPKNILLYAIVLFVGIVLKFLDIQQVQNKVLKIIPPTTTTTRHKLIKLAIE